MTLQDPVADFKAFITANYLFANITGATAIIPIKTMVENMAGGFSRANGVLIINNVGYRLLNRAGSKKHDEHILTCHLWMPVEATQHEIEVELERIFELERDNATREYLYDMTIDDVNYNHYLKDDLIITMRRRYV